jgi:hypothetical protein
VPRIVRLPGSIEEGEITSQSARGPLALRRKAEVQRCAEILGIETQVLDIHDGELLPTLENRRHIARLIRDWLIDRDAEVADRYRHLLVERYGERRGREIKYAEAFELCQYGSQPSAEELNEWFPL